MLEEFEDTERVRRIRKSKKDRQCNGRKKKDKRTNYNLQSTTQKTIYRSKRTPLRTGDEHIHGIL